MTESSLFVLRELLVTRYDELKAKLTQRLGSPDIAGEAVQDTWLRLQKTQRIGNVANPAAYLFQIALNVARNRLASERRNTPAAQIDDILDVQDEAADTASIVESRSELQLVEELIQELPSRQREILVAARLDGLPRDAIAKRLGISLSLVEKELRMAHEYCLARLAQRRK